MTPKQVHSMAISILEILLYLQSRNVIHRDLKPENIVLGEDGEYYLIDFGFSSVEQSVNPQNGCAQKQLVIV